MKTTLTALLAILTFASTATLTAQNRITVEATNDDISYNLDLKAVATVFADSKNLEDFEMRINDYNSNISNLDLNGDGEIDYLRVIETHEKSINLVVIQAVLDIDIYQDVATIVVEGKSSKRASIRVIGDPYIYGANYVFEPVYYSTPVIYSWFWTPRRIRWHSPYYWGYYPVCYHRVYPFSVNIYLTNIRHHTNYNYQYRYYDSYNNSRALALHRNVSRNDYANRNPQRDFSRRNTNVANAHDFERQNRNNNNRRDIDNSRDGGRGNGNYNSNNGADNRSSNNGTTTRPTRNTSGSSYNSESRPATRPSTSTRTRPAATESNSNVRSSSTNERRENAAPAKVETRQSSRTATSTTTRDAAKPSTATSVEKTSTAPKATPKVEKTTNSNSSSSSSSTVNRPATPSSSRSSSAPRSGSSSSSSSSSRSSSGNSGGGRR